MNKYKIEFSEELKKHGLKDYSTTSQLNKQDYLQAIRFQVYQDYNLDPQLLNGNKINIYGE